MANRTSGNGRRRAAGLAAVIALLSAGTPAHSAPATRLSLAGDRAAIELVASGSAAATTVAAADVNDDGATDLVVGVAGPGGGAVLVWRGNPALVYGRLDADLEPIQEVGVVRATPAAPDSLRIEDTNRDGQLDVTVTSEGGEASVLLDLGSADLAPVDVAVAAFKAPADPLRASGRFNADAIPDVVEVNQVTFVPTVSLSKARAAFSVTETADAGAGSLRQAILDANASSGADTITFDIGAATKSIALTSPLPAISEAVTIDATTQSGFAGIPIVELSGAAAGGGVDGFDIQAASCVVRGFAINGFTGRGVVVSASSCIIEGNHIGTNLAGTAIVANGGSGIVINSAGSTIIGGLTPASRNIISGNGSAGVLIGGSGATANSVLGNYIGTNRAGAAGLSNSGSGVVLALGANSGTVGGASAGAQNVISGNVGHGVLVDVNVGGFLVSGNRIGTTADAAGSIPNKGDGVRVGGLNGFVLRNRIVGNGGAGVFILSTASGVSTSENGISGNSGLGIDLDPNDVTANDPGDADTGANDLQNFPVLTGATSIGSTTTIDGTLLTEANATYRIEFFASPSCDPSGSGEGDVFLGFTEAITDGSGAATYSASFMVSVSASQSITATATDSFGNTSEFSPCLSAETVADLSITLTADPSPVPAGSNLTYAVTIRNAGPLPATDVAFAGATPSGTVFTSATTTDGTLTAPSPGQVGAIACAIGVLPPSGRVDITIVVQVVGPPTLTIVNTVFTSTSTPEVTLENNTATVSTLVIEPPAISSITKVADAPFRLRITGSNFKAGVTVFIATDATPWPNVKVKDPGTIILRKGSALKDRFPKGVPVLIRVVNTDGGTAMSTFTR